MIADDEIDAFWMWFAENAQRISSDPEDEVLLDELGLWVSRLECPAWEIGPGTRAEWFLALSPNGDDKCLPLTRTIISRAPTVPGWEFFPYRPKKRWDLQFEIEGESGPIDVDARTWTFVAYRYPDGVYDLVVSVGDSELEPEARDLAARIVVEGQLGEEAFLTKVHEVEAVAELSPDQAAHAKPVSLLEGAEPA